MFYCSLENFVEAKLLTPELPNECSGHLQILLCPKPDDFTRQWGTPGKGLTGTAEGVW